MSQNNLTVGDYILYKFESDKIPLDIWVGVVEKVDSHGYLVKNITSPALFYLKIPFDLALDMEKLDPKTVNSTIKTIKLLFYT